MNIEKLKAVIQAANPEIMELEFGCEVIVDGIRADNPGCEYDVVTDGRVWDGMIVLGYFGRVSLSKVKILGRPIRLADVVLALGERYAVDGKGFLLERAFGTDDYNLAGMPGGWNLKDDSLDHQSDECKQFLYDLLVTK